MEGPTLPQLRPKAPETGRDHTGVPILSFKSQIHVDSVTSMLPTDSIGKLKIKTKTEKSYEFDYQLLGESIEKQKNGTRMKF